MELYVGLDGVSTGPFSVEQVADAIDAGRIDGTTLVWTPGMPGWAPASSMSELSRLFSARDARRRQPSQPPLAPGPAPQRTSGTGRAAPSPGRATGTPVPRGNRDGLEDDAFDSATLPLPTIGQEQVLDMEAVRDPYERFYFRFVVAANVVAALALIAIAVTLPMIAAAIIGYGLLLAAIAWAGWQLFRARVLGNCVQVGPTQYPLIHRVVEQAMQYLEIDRPEVFVMQGHGLFEILVGKFMRDRGVLILTSGLLDEIVKRPTSRELMMYVGRQLGHIRAGHFSARFFKNGIGLLAGPFYFAWRRHCHLTADRIGLLCAGELHAAEQAMLMITVGPAMAEQTEFSAVAQQRERLIGSFWAWMDKILSTYPQMIVRLVKLREYAATLGLRPRQSNEATTVGALPIHHTYLRAVPLLLIHGHDRVALYELKAFLLEQYPHIAPKIMAAEHHGTLGMSEKFDRIAGSVVGAIALLTPDDTGAVAASEPQARPLQARARQNVVLEVGWAWGKLGRESFMMLKRGDVEMPSDLSGADVQTFHQSPSECARALNVFIDGLVRRHQLM